MTLVRLSARSFDDMPECPAIQHPGDSYEYVVIDQIDAQLHMLVIRVRQLNSIQLETFISSYQSEWHRQVGAVRLEGKLSNHLWPTTTLENFLFYNWNGKLRYSLTLMVVLPTVNAKQRMSSWKPS